MPSVTATISATPASAASSSAGPAAGAGTITIVADAPAPASPPFGLCRSGRGRGDDPHRGGRARPGTRFLDRREHRDAFHVGAGLLRAYAADDLRAVCLFAQAVEAALPAGQTLHDH